MDVLAALEMYFRFSKIEISVSSDTTALIDHALLAKWAMDGILAERSKFLIGDDKSALVGYNQKIIEQGIYTNTRLFKLTQNPQYLHALFEFIESNKSLNLAEEIVRVNTFNKSYATTNYETDKIDSLKNILVSLDRRKIYEPNNVNLISRIANIHDSLDRWTNQLPFLNNESTQNLQLFKTYSLHEVLHSLTKNQSILEFYQGLDMIYILLMQTNKLDIKAIPRSKDLDEQIQYYHLALTAPIHTDYSFNPRALDSLYQVSATRLFQVLIGDWESILRGQILIIPDGNFHLIPFASLLIQKRLRPILRRCLIGYVIMLLTTNIHLLSGCNLIVCPQTMLCNPSWRWPPLRVSSSKNLNMNWSKYPDILCLSLSLIIKPPNNYFARLLRIIKFCTWLPMHFPILMTDPVPA